MKRVFFLACALIICLTLPASAHKGRTDANGGHYDHSTGEYHYHHGYPAHQHVNGICPYDFDDKTNHDSGGTSSSSVASKSNRSVGSSGGTDIPAEWIGFAAGLSVVGLLVFWYVYLKYNEWKDAKLKREEEYRKLSQRCLRLEEENRQLQEKFQRENRRLQEQVQRLRADKASLRDEVHVLRLKVKRHPELSEFPNQMESLPPHQESLPVLPAEIVTGPLETVVEIVPELPAKETTGDITSIETEEGIVTKTPFEIEKERFTEMLSGESLLDLSGAPSGVEIGPDGLPKDIESLGWGPHFTYYVAQKGTCFHCKAGCSGAYRPIHLMKIHGLQPCSRCSPRPMPTDWYDEYLRLKAIKDRYGIK